MTEGRLKQTAVVRHHSRFVDRKKVDSIGGAGIAGLHSSRAQPKLAG